MFNVILSYELNIKYRNFFYTCKFIICYDDKLTIVNVCIGEIEPEKENELSPKLSY